MAEQGIAEVVWQAPQPRIVQYRNRRYSIRLEPVFWRTLAFLAERRGLRLGRFIGELAEDYDGPNFASHLRVVCMAETERARAEASLRPSRVNVVDLILSCPSPGLVLSRYRTVLAFNPSFAQWIGAGNEPATGADLTSVIQVRPRRPLNEVWLDMIAGKVSSVDANVVHVAPGRATAASGRLIALIPQQNDEFYAVMWLSAARRPATVAPIPSSTVPSS